MPEKMQPDTLLVHTGKNPSAHGGTVNVPVYRASTILFPTLEALDNKKDNRVNYGRRGTPTTHALEDAINSLEQSDHTLLTPSGVMALSIVLMTYAEPGAHYLICDNSYGPTRKFCEGVLRKMGVETTYYDPCIGEEIEALIRPETKLIWMESPGSQTFEIQDIPTIVAVARKYGVVTVIDNTWSGGVFFKPLLLGVDISVQAGTKYIAGHSDLMLGTIAFKQDQNEYLRDTYQRFGVCISPDDAYLALRGLRTIGVRMRQHHLNGLKVAQWLQSQDQVLQVLHPELPDNPFHDLWKKQFSGSSGLFGFIIRKKERSSVARMFDGLKLFGMGSSWGGYESLMIPTNPSVYRSATDWCPPGQTIRIHVGLEDPLDLIADITAGFARLS